MRREGTGLIHEQPLITHACHMLDDLVGTQVIPAGLIGAVGVIVDDDIESQPVSLKAWPDLLWRRRRIGAIKDTTSIRLNRVKQRVQRRVMIRRERCHLIATDAEGRLR
jgi:hypothetical protein